MDTEGNLICQEQPQVACIVQSALHNHTQNSIYQGMIAKDNNFCKEIGLPSI